MPPKRLERQRVETTSSTDEDQDDHVKGDPTVLQPKPCQSCGREISPRAKWRRNWDEIRFCSDRCKSWRSTYVFSVSDNRTALAKADSCLMRCIEIHDDRLLFHLDAWIEALIVTVAAKSRPNALKRLQDVSARMHDELGETSHHDVSQRISTVLSQGEREMIRRAARRMIVLPRQSLALIDRTADVFLPPTSVLVLTQNGGKGRLLSLSDVSHAKGDIEIALERSAS